MSNTNKTQFTGSVTFLFSFEKIVSRNSEAYDKYASSISTCKYWFRRFKIGNFVTENKERPGQKKKFEDEKLKALLDEHSCQTLGELADSLNVDLSTINKRLPTMRIVQKQGY